MFQSVESTALLTTYPELYKQSFATGCLPAHSYTTNVLALSS